MLERVDHWKEFPGSDPPESELLREKVGTGDPCGSDELMREGGRLTADNYALIQLVSLQDRKEQTTYYLPRVSH